MTHYRERLSVRRGRGLWWAKVQRGRGGANWLIVTRAHPKPGALADLLGW